METLAERGLRGGGGRGAELEEHRRSRATGWVVREQGPTGQGRRESRAQSWDYTKASFKQQNGHEGPY